MIPRIPLSYKELSRKFEYDPSTGAIFKLCKNKRKVGTNKKLKYRRYTLISCYVDGVRKKIPAHRIAWCLYFKTDNVPDVIDHINGNGYDNRIVNLRASSDAKNQINSKRPPPTSGYRGVYWHKRDKIYIAKTKIRGKPYHIGSFHCPKKAHRAYLYFIKDLHGITPPT